VQHTPVPFKVSLSRPKFTLILIALDTSINKIFVVFSAASRAWLKMVSSEFSTGMGFGDITIPTTILIAFSDG
jgi:hypothetical protein